MDDDRIEGFLPVSLTRRRLLGLGLAAAPTLLLASACRSDDGSAAATGSPGAGNGSLTPTPACGDDDDTLTPEQTEGPFFSSGSPERTSIRDGDGTDLVVSGTVLATDCRALANAKLDFWHADDDGVYDNSGYDFRGHQFTDAQGRYRLETIVPALYPGRTRHIHVKVQPEGGPVLTTQLYFPGESQNQSDSLFESDCLMDVSTVGDGQAATFTFVVEA
jgi:protocatechuate 3,4-dioxygenase beta subunit